MGDRLAWWWFRGRSRRRDERERHAVDLGVLGRELSVVVEGERPATKATTDDLLAQELRAECPDTKDVRDSRRIPSLGQHRDRDDAADVASEPARLADRVHDLPENVLVGETLNICPGETLSVLSLELLNLCRGSTLELWRQRIPSVELLGVHEDRHWSMRQPPACSFEKSARAPGTIVVDPS